MPLRIYDIAVKLGIESKDVIAKARALGISAARVPSSSLDKITAEYLIEQLGDTVPKAKASPSSAPVILLPSVSKLGSWRSRLVPKSVENSPQRQSLKRPTSSEPWTSIDDLPTNWRKLINPGTANQAKAWLEQAEQLKNSESYKEFLIRLRREWAIETGVLERLYTISEGATKTLTEKGLDAAYLSHADTDKRPEDVIAMIRDQEEAINGLQEFVTGQVPLLPADLL